MSSIGEAKEQILAVSASSDDALEAALESYRVVTEGFADVTNSVSAGQAAVEGCAEILG
jgi:hypothetical protein